MTEYDLAIIGSGPGGYVAGIRAAQLGARTVVIEKAELGGACLNRGCIPSKAMLQSAALLLQTKRLSEFGIFLNGSIIFDWQAILQRKNKIVQTLRNGLAFLFKKNKVELISGEGKLIAPDKITVTEASGKTEVFTAKKIILATGSQPAMIPAFNIDRRNIITSDEVFELTKLPMSMIIAGAGVIGCEFATLFSALGVKIILIELLPRILQLTPIPESITLRVAAALKRQGVHILTGTKISSLSIKNGHVIAELADGQSFSAEKALVSIGRELNTKNIGLQESGVEVSEKNFIRTDEFMRTSQPNIYAIGDITGHQQLAHLASRQGILAVEHACVKQGLEPINYQAVPACVFTEPPVAFVGESEAELQQKGVEYKIAEFPYKALGIAHTKGELEGKVWLIAEKKNQHILGGSIYGYAASELIHIITLGIANSLTIKEMNRLISTHPTFSEAISETLLSLQFLPIHS